MNLMDKVKVSVIIPVYNVEKYLPACLDSVLGQTLKEIEIICIDDASPDGCPQILDHYALKDKRMKVIHLTENHRQGYGRNRGIEAASGKYIYLLDSDDMITADALEKLWHYAEAEDLDAVFFDSDVIFESEKLAKRHASYITGRKGYYEDKVYAGPELFDAFVRYGEWTCYIQRQFWRRSHLEKNHVTFPEATEHEDEYFAWLGLMTAERVRLTKDRFFLRRYRDNSVMTANPAPKNFHGCLRNCYLMTVAAEQYGWMDREAVRWNIARMFVRAQRLYEKLSAEYDLSAIFPPEQKVLYDVFLGMTCRSSYYDKVYENISCRFADGKTLDEYRHIFIYGAGDLAVNVFAALTEHGYMPEAFLVTSMRGNPERLRMKPVRPVSEVAKPVEPAIVIVAVTDGFQREVKETLDELGWDYV